MGRRTKGKRGIRRGGVEVRGVMCGRIGRRSGVGLGMLRGVIPG